MKVQSQFIEMFKDCSCVKIGDYINTQSGGTPNTKNPEYYDGGTIPWLSSGEINQGYINDTEKYISEEGLNNSSAKWVPENSVVIAMYGATAGKVGFLNIRTTTNQAVCSLLPNDSFCPKYLYFAISSQSKWMIAQCRGAAQPNISQGIIRNMKIPFPSKELQEQFVSICEQADKSKFEGFKSQFIEMFGDPMTNSKSWVQYSLISEQAQIVLGSTPNSKNPGYWDGELRWITPAEMTEESYYIYDTERHITEEGRSAANLTLLPYNFVLFSTRAPIGKVGLVGTPMYCNQGFKNFICKETLNPVYLYYTLIFKREYLVSLGTGTTFKELSKKAVERLKIAVPPIELQNKFETIYQQADKSKKGSLLLRMAS